MDLHSVSAKWRPYEGALNQSPLHFINGSQRTLARASCRSVAPRPRTSSVVSEPGDYGVAPEIGCGVVMIVVDPVPEVAALSARPLVA